MNTLRVFTEHPASVGESYFGHLRQASGFGLRLLVAGLACVLHGILPFLFVTTASDAVRDLHAEITARRTRALGREPTVR